MAWDDGLNEFLRQMGPTSTTPIELLPNGVRIGGMMWTYPSNPTYAGMTLSPYGGLSTPQISLLSAEQYQQGALDYLYRLAGRSAPSPLVLDQIVLANVRANTPRGIGAAAGGSGSGGGGGGTMTPLPTPATPVGSMPIPEGPLVMMGFQEQFFTKNMGGTPDARRIYLGLAAGTEAPTAFNLAVAQAHANWLARQYRIVGTIGVGAVLAYPVVWLLDKILGDMLSADPMRDTGASIGVPFLP